MKNLASKSETEVLKVLWSQPGSTSLEIHEALKPHQGWSTTTVKTLLSRLSQKGLVTTKKDGRRFLYFAISSENESMLDRIDSLMTTLCATNVGTVIQHLIEAYDLSVDDKEKLIQAINNKSFKDSLKCSCVMNHEACGCTQKECSCHK